MTGEETRLLGIVLCILGCLVLAVTQPLLSLWHKKWISGTSVPGKRRNEL